MALEVRITSTTLQIQIQKKVKIGTNQSPIQYLHPLLKSASRGNLAI